MNMQEIKQEEKLNGLFHKVLEEVPRFKNDLIGRRVVIIGLKRAMKEAGFWTIEGDYKLPLPKCESCKIKEHCIKAKQKSCPNELQSPQKRMGHIKHVYGSKK